MSKRGKVTLICGPMFSQKSTEALMILEKHQVIGGTFYFKITLRDQDKIIVPTKDLQTHSGRNFHGYYAKPNIELGFKDIWHVLTNHENNVAIALDEIQFLPLATLKSLVKKFVQNGIDVVLVGIDIDYRGEVFETTAWASIYADVVIKKTAICHDCHGVAKYNYNAANYDAGSSRFREGESSWFPLCLNCWEKRTGLQI